MGQSVDGQGADVEPVTFCLGNINPGDVAHVYLQSVLALYQSPTSPSTATQFHQYLAKSPAGPYLDVQRNVVTQQFIASDADVLVFVDADMAFEPAVIHTLARLAHDECAVVGGCYVNYFPDAGMRPVAFAWGEQTDDAGRTFPKLHPVPIPTGNEDHLRPVDVIGTGLLAIPRYIFDRLSEHFAPPTPWFAEVAMGGVQMGEDVTFCARVKAIGGRVLYAPWLQAAHYKVVRLEPGDVYQPHTPTPKE